MAAKADAPGARDIPWLLLVAQPDAARPGALAHVSHIQRINTRSGLTPAGDCVVGESARVAYTADYVFYETAR